MITRLYWMAAAVLVASGCIHTSKIEGEMPKPPRAFSGADSGKNDKKPGKASRFWKLFKDPNLDRLVARALKENLDLGLAWRRLESSRASLMLSKGGYWPSLALKADAGRSSSIVSSALGEQRVDRDTLQVSLAASYEIDLWGKVRYGVKAARHTLRASEYDVEAALISVAAQITDSYFLAASLRAQLLLLDQTIGSRTRHLELVKRRYMEGVVTALDLYQAQGNLAGARAQKATFSMQLKITEHAIALLLGRAPGKKVSGSLDRLPKEVIDLPAGLPADLLLQRPDLRAAHHKLMAADAGVGKALADHFPSLTLSASVGYAFDPMGWIWSLLGSLTAPLFQGQRISANVALKRAVLRQALDSFKVSLLRALKDVEDALVSGKQLREQVRWQEAAVTAAEGALRMSLDQYAQGLITFLPVLTAEQSVYNARTSLIKARRELISARIQLARALGGGWMKKEFDNQKEATDRVANR